ncbi:unnamed protein product [Diabrotica balteata]|uniref:Uncharacterized protein n=1 Tax=Diabrotica balteata TaxID=107213 RepID=A0A9N9SN59_DIABA|nr:unnamed protein product [Diabrotica balteata]
MERWLKVGKRDATTSSTEGECSKAVRADNTAITDQDDYATTSSFKGEKKELRYGKEKPRPRISRKTKLQVEPGKSVANLGEESVGDPESTEESEMSNDSTSEEDFDTVALGENEEPIPEIDYMSINEEDFIVVKCKDLITKKKVVLFSGDYCKREQQG